MYPPIFQVISASTAVTDLLGTNPVRFWLFGEAPQNPGLPYVVWQTAYGAPENYLGGVPDIDHLGVQIDVYASTASVVRQVAAAVRDAIEPRAYVVGWRGEGLDPETKLYNLSFDAEFFVSR